MRVTPLALAVVLLSGCGGSHSPAAPTPTATERAAGARPASDADALQALLDRRAAALQRGDSAVFAATSAGAPRAARRTLTLAALARPDAIARLDHLRQAAAYAYSSAAAFYVADHYGSRRLLALCDAFNDESLTGAADVALSDRATRRVLHVSLATLDRQIRQALT